LRPRARTAFPSCAPLALTGHRGRRLARETRPADPPHRPAPTDRATGRARAGGGMRTAPATTQDHSMTHLNDETALITGGGRGIGRAIARFRGAVIVSDCSSGAPGGTGRANDDRRGKHDG